MTDLSDGYVVGDGIKLEYSPLDDSGGAIEGAAANITLTIKEPGEDAVTKTGGDLTEDAGTYFYWHKVTKPGITTGHWVYDGAANQDGADNFRYYAAPKA